jgi:nucleoside-diphosphate-sugar epimerase
MLSPLSPPEICRKRVLVTGAGGFMGPAVVRGLLDTGMEVRALLGAPGQSVGSLPAAVSTALAEITDEAGLAGLVAGVEIVVHMAGFGSVEASFENPVECVRTHVAGTAAALHASLKAGVRRFIYVSSAEVYGRTRAHAAHEDLPLRPRSPYGAAKAGAEHLVAAFARSFDLPCLILRPFSVYGPGISIRSVVGSILRMARAGDSVSLNEPGVVRDFLYAADVADALSRAISVDFEGVLAVNLGTGRGTSLRELVETIARIVGRRLEVRQRQGAGRRGKSEIHRLVASVARAERILGWRARTSLENGLRQTVRSMTS